MFSIKPLVYKLFLISGQIQSDWEDECSAQRECEIEREKEREVEEERPWWEAEGVQENINETQLMRAKTE